MYCARTDPARALAVWCWNEGTASAEDWHRHLADMRVVREWKHARTRPHPLVRGAMRMFSWFQAREPYRIAAFPDVHSAVSWLEADRGEKLPQLLELLAQAQRELGIAR